MGQVIELPRVGGPGTGSGGLWRVIVLNDDFNTFDHVAETLARVVPGLTLADGYRFADQIYLGLERYVRKRAEAESAAAPGVS